MSPVRIVAVNAAMLAVLGVAVFGLRGKFARPDADHEQYRSIEARLIDERQWPRRETRGGTIFAAQPEPRDDGRVTTMVMNGQTGIAIPKLTEEARDGDPEALTNLSAALLTHPVAAHWPPDAHEVSTTLEALVAARKAIARSPRLAAAHFNLALALTRLGFTREASVEYEAAATLESNPAWSAEARRRKRELQSNRPLDLMRAAARYVGATASPASRAILQAYLAVHERTPDRSQWNTADVPARLERAARFYDNGGLSPDLLPRVFSSAAMVLSSAERRDLYMQRYLIAGGLHRTRRTTEAIATLRMLDADVYQTLGQRGWTAQIVCEEAIDSLVTNKPKNALKILRDAFQRSEAKREAVLAKLYADLASEIQTHLMQTALAVEGVPAALRYTDGSIYGPDDDSDVDVDVKVQTTRPSRTGATIRYGDLLLYLSECRQQGLAKPGLVPLPKNPTAVSPPKSSAAQIQRALPRDAAIVEYATARDAVMAFVIRTHDVDVVFLHASAADVRRVAHAMRRANDETFPIAAGHLYELVLAPVASRLEGVSTIAFIPSRDLAGIPFGALLDAQRGQFLIERMAVVHARSSRAAITASRAWRKAHDATTLAIAATDFDHDRYPDAAALPAALREADSIATLSACTRLLAGPDATAEAMRRELAENAVIHYAGHIVRRGADVWLPLMPHEGRDGLSATEIAQLPLTNARVVVLSACRGASPSAPGDVMPTMADAFVAAGVPAVIASSYDIDDSDAPATMRRLHTYLRDGEDAASALRKTAIDELRAGRGLPLSLRFMAVGGARELVK